MTLEEALAELGLHKPATPDDARQAYLRLLKVRKPEKDPSGFMRLREAYELAKPGLSLEANLEAQGDGAPLPTASASADAQPKAYAPDREGVPAPSGEGSELAPFRAEFQALPGDAALEATVDIARRAVAASAQSPQAHRWLVAALAAAGRPAEATEALRAAERSAWPGALIEAAIRFPEHLNDDEFEQVLEDAAEPLLWEVAGACRDARLARRTARAIHAGFRECLSDEIAREGSESFAFETVLWLQEDGFIEEAVTLMEDLRKCLWNREPRPVLGVDQIAEKWHQVSALNAVAPELPAAVRKALARAVRMLDIEALAQELTAFTISSPDAARAAAAVIRGRAPELIPLARYLAPETAPKRRMPYWWPKYAVGGWLWRVILGASVVAAAAWLLTIPTEASRRFERAGGPPAPEFQQAAWKARNLVCDAAERPHRSCHAVHEFAHRIAISECEDLRYLLRAIAWDLGDDEARDAGTSQERENRQAARRTIWWVAEGVCPAEIRAFAELMKPRDAGIAPEPYVYSGEVRTFEELMTRLTKSRDAGSSARSH